VFYVYCYGSRNALFAMLLAWFSNNFSNEDVRSKWYNQNLDTEHEKPSTTCQKLNLRFEEGIQDWPYEVANADDDNIKFLLMQAIIQATEEQ